MSEAGSSPWDDPNAPHNYRREPQEGYTRVWYDTENFLDYSSEDFSAVYADYNTSGFKIVADPWRLENIDAEPITLYYSHGAEYTVASLGLIGQPTGIQEKYFFDSGLIFPATGDLQITLSEHYVPRLFLLRMAIHDAVRQAIADRIQLAAIVAAFAQVIGLNSSGGTPTTADEINRLIKIAQEAHDQ